MDCICCGFGAILLLFVLALGKPQLESDGGAEEAAQQQAMLAEQMAQLRSLQEQQAAVAAYQGGPALADVEQEQAALAKKIAEAKEELAGLKRGLPDVSAIAQAQLLQENFNKDAETPLGLRTDLTHVALIVDTSGSMRDRATGQLKSIVLEYMRRVLDSYPQLDSIQFLNCSGDYMMQVNRKRWISDDPRVRSTFIGQVAKYGVASVSDPVPGIVQAINDLSSQVPAEGKMGVILFGDEYPGLTAPAMARLEQINPLDSSGDRRVSINAVGFPNVLRGQPRSSSTGYRYAVLMREIVNVHEGSLLLVND